MTAPTSISPGVAWHQRAGIWIGIATSPGALVVGGGLAAVLSPSALLLTIPIGALILTSLSVAQGVISRRRRENLPQRALGTFGPGFGSGLLNLVMVFSTVGWISFYLSIAGFSLTTLFNLSRLLNFSSWVGVLILLLVTLGLNEIGLSRWNILAWLTTVSALAAAIVALAIVAPAIVPAEITAPFGISGFLWGIGTVVSYSLVFAVRCSDFTWDMRSDLDVIKDGFAYYIPVLIMFAIGVILYRRTGEWNLADILAQTESAGLGHIFLVLAVVAPILTNFHSGILALQSLVPLSKRLGALCIGSVTFILGATRFDRQLLPFLDLLGAILIPTLVVMLIAVSSPRKSTAIALWAWLGGSIVALMFKLQGQLIHLVVGAAVSLVIFYGLSFSQRSSRL